MHKILNKNTVKVSYSCKKDMDSIISGHNHNILNPKEKSFGCNCRKKDSCPLNGKCLTTKLIYYAGVSKETNSDQKVYFGLAETTFKERYNNHKRDVKHIKYQYNTESTKYIWSLKNNIIKCNIQWKVVDKVYSNANWTMCKLYLREKLWIINHISDYNIMNKKSELINNIKTCKEETVNLSFMRICIFVFLF